MNHKEYESNTNIVEILTEVVSANTKNSTKLAALHQLKLWRENLFESFNTVSIDSMCTNCASPIPTNKKDNDRVAKPSVHLWLEVETRCNLSCRFCYNFWRGGIKPEPKTLETKTFINGLHRILSSVDCQALSIAGGEPLLQVDLVEILSAIKPYSIPISVVTNGTLLTRKKISQLKQVGVNSFQVALHSHCEQIHNTLSFGQSWKKALQSIIWLRESGTQVTPVFVATKMNMSDFPEVLKICSYLGVNQIIFNRFVPTGQGEVYQEQIGVPEYEQILSILEKANNIAVREGIKIILGVPIEASEQIRSRFQSIDWASCPVHDGQSRWVIGADLQIRRCNSFTDGLGNIFDEGFDKLLNELTKSYREGQVSSQIRPCQILENSKFVQIISKRSTYLALT